MKLETKNLQRFVGGQIEVQNPKENYLYRGEIATIEITEGEKVRGVQRDNYGDLKITLRWMAKMNDEHEWEKDDHLTYAASLLIYNAADLGDGRIFLSGMYTGEAVSLFPKDYGGGEGLDPARVKGLRLAA